MVAGETLPRHGGPRHAHNHFDLGEWIRGHRRKTAVIAAGTVAVALGVSMPLVIDGSSAGTGQHLVLKGDPCDAIADAAAGGVTSTYCSAGESPITLAKIDVNTTFNGNAPGFEINVLDAKQAAAWTLKQWQADTSSPAPEDFPYLGFDQGQQHQVYHDIKLGGIMVAGQQLATMYETHPNADSGMTITDGQTQMLVSIGGNYEMAMIPLGGSNPTESDYQQAAAATVGALFEPGQPG